MSEWFKEHDWKSCVRLKRTGGSNPLLCANKKEICQKAYLFFVLLRIQKRIRGWEAFCESKNGLLLLVYLTIHTTANWTIDNCPSGRAAKGENPLLCANEKTHPIRVCFFVYAGKRLRPFRIRGGSREQCASSQYKPSDECSQHCEALLLCNNFPLLCVK